MLRLCFLVGLLVLLVPAQEVLDGPQLRFAFRRSPQEISRSPQEDNSFYDILLPPIAKKSLRQNAPQIYLLPNQMGRGIELKWEGNKKRKPRQFHISFVGIELADFVANKEGSGSPRLKEKLFKSG